MEGKDRCAENTDVELWEEVKDDYYSPRIFVTKHGNIGINVGGMVHVLPVKKWFKLAQKRDTPVADPVTLGKIADEMDSVADSSDVRHRSHNWMHGWARQLRDLSTVASNA